MQIHRGPEVERTLRCFFAVRQILQPKEKQQRGSVLINGRRKTNQKEIIINKKCLQKGQMAWKPKTKKQKKKRKTN